MSDPRSSESWQVDVNGQIYSGSFQELTDWIADGSLLPGDMVRRGNLRWIEARKVPSLVAFFNAKTGTVSPSAVGSMTAQPSGSVRSDAAPTVGTSAIRSDVFQSPVSSTPDNAFTPTGGTDNCINHSGIKAHFMCSSCNGSLCRDCTKAYGTSVRICAACGGMCKERTALETERSVAEFRSAAIGTGFGFRDFAEAIAYPFKFKTSLIFGGLMFMFFSVGQLSSSFGGIYMITASIFSYMLANMLTFGILANTVENFAHGKIGGNFMPDFEDFSARDDVIHPFFLSVAVYISSFGAFIAVFLVGLYLVFSTVSTQLDAMKTKIEQTPGTPYYNVRDTGDQSRQVREVVANVERLNKRRLEEQQAAVNESMRLAEEGLPDESGVNRQNDVRTLVDEEEREIQKLNDLINEHRRQSIQAPIVRPSPIVEAESPQMLAAVLKLAAPIVILGALAFLWGAFYFPAACAVAGYTRSFVATINPMVGLDTIRRLGIDYAKILVMVLVLVISTAAIGAVLSVVFIAFDMPGVGNLPAKAVGSLFTFYIAIVFSCVLGFAMFKASDRLRIR